MAEGRVVDTNVLIVASAEHEGSPFKPHATPIEERELRRRVLDWLEEFERDSERHVVLDYDWHICDEYGHKLTEQDYGLLAIRAKMDRHQVIWVGLDTDEHGNAVLSPELGEAVTDLADRKMVAAVLAASQECDSCKLTNACDTDWLDCEEALAKANVRTENLLEDWLREKWRSRRNNTT